MSLLVGNTINATEIEVSRELLVGLTKIVADNSFLFQIPLAFKAYFVVAWSLESENIVFSIPLVRNWTNTVVENVASTHQVSDEPGDRSCENRSLIVLGDLHSFDKSNFNRNLAALLG